MILNSIHSLQRYLKSYFTDTLHQDDTQIKVSSLSKDETEPLEGIIITLVHIEEESSVKPQSAYDPVAKKEYKNPALLINLYVLISAQDKDYETAVKNISSVIKAFQANSTIAFDGDMDNQLRVELYKASLEQNLNLWQTLGCKIMPSVMYKIKMIEIQNSTEIGVHEILNRDITYRKMGKQNIEEEEKQQ